MEKVAIQHKRIKHPQKNEKTYVNDTRMEVATEKTSGSEKYGAHASAHTGRSIEMNKSTLLFMRK